MAASPPRAQAQLIYANRTTGTGAGRTLRAFTFPLNPNAIDSGRTSRYPNVNLAQHDAGTLSFGTVFEWTGNEPQSLSINFVLHARGDADVEEDIATLDSMQDKSGRTGEPPDLVFQYGPLKHLGRVESMNYKTRQWTKDGRRQFVECSMRFKVLVPNFA